MTKSYTHYHDIILPVILNNPNSIYLRSINQKRLFSRKRLMLLKKAIAKYNQKQTISTKKGSFQMRKTTSFSMEIEFDHFVVSLRSYIEHLMQLINSIADLGLNPISYKRDDRVDIDNVITLSKKSNNTIINRLGNYLVKEKKKDWYKTLHKLRIEIYHNKFEKFLTLGEQVSLELPDNTEVDLITYCNSAMYNVERILSYSAKSLVEFLN